MVEFALVIGTIVLITGIVLGIIKKKEESGFAWWLTVIGVGFIITGIVLAQGR